MANSFVRYTGNGSTTAYAIPFSYRVAGDLTVTINASATTAFTFNAAGTTLTFNTAPANASAIEIRRTTSQTSRLTDYSSGSVLTESDLDTDSTQAFFMGQEAIDDAADKIAIDSSDFQWNATSKRIKNVTDPTGAQDAATKNYLENTWLTTANKAALTTINSNIANINSVNSNASNINSAVSNASNINTVASNIANVNTVATDITKVIAVANDLAEAVSEIETVADDLNEATSEIDTVSNNIANVNTVGGISSNVTTVAGISSNVSTVAGVASNVSTVAGISADVSAVAGISGDVQAVENIAANVTTVANNNTNINTVAGVASNVTTVAGIASNVTNVAGKLSQLTLLGTSDAVSDMNVLGTSDVVNDMNVLGTSANVTAMNTLGTNTNVSNMSTLAGINGNITTVAGISSNVTTVAGISSAVTGVNNIASNITSVNSNSTNINTVAGAISNVNTVGGAIANVNTVASNISGVNSFGERYRISSSALTSSLNVGDLYFDTNANELKVYKSSGWAAAGSTVNGTSQRYHYDISGTPTTVSGADASGATLAYDAGFIDVFLNGVRMSTADITITSGTSVVFASALSNGDEVDIVAYGTFNVAAMNASNLNSGTVPDARITGAYTGITDLTTSGNLTVDTNTLFVNASTNTVGIGEASPLGKLHVKTADSGGSAQSTNDELVVEGSGDTGIQILGGSSNDCGIAFGDASDSNVGLMTYNHTSNYMRFKVNASEALRILNDGKVGIGESSPLGKLHIKTADSGGSANANADELILEGAGSGAGVGMGILSATDGFGYIVFGDSGGNAQGGIQYHNNGDSMRIYTNDAERMRIDSAGDVGIGTTNPLTQLHLKGGGANDSVGAPIITIQKRSGGAVDDGQTNRWNVVCYK